MKALRVLKTIGKVILTIAMVIAIGCTVALNYKTLLSAHKNKDVIAAATATSDMTIPEGVQIVGLGEATHGSREFQEAKLDVFRMLVEKYDYRAIALEADYCDCLAANAYVQGGDGDARDIVNHLAFTIYHTEQMADLLSWMREYNASVPEDKRLRIYGFDMQNPEQGVSYLVNYLEAHHLTDCDTSALLDMADPNRTEALTQQDITDIRTELSTIDCALATMDNEDLDVILLRKAVKNMTTTMDYCEVPAEDSYTFRDNAMAANVTWILEQEKAIGTGKLLLAAHDGHISKAPHTIMYEETMGGLLKEQYGDAYYSLGTDFFKGSANIRVDMTAEYTRKNFYLHSADPMAYQAKYMEDKRYFMDFTSLDASEDAKVYDMVHSEMSMGSAGEGFSALYYFFHSTYRVNMAPADLYDGMIYYYEVGATSPEA